MTTNLIKKNRTKSNKPSKASTSAKTERQVALQPICLRRPRQPYCCTSRERGHLAAHEHRMWCAAYCRLPFTLPF